MNDEIKKCIDVLYNGGVILYPTDTVWGLGCDATNPEAVKKIYKIKQRSETKSMLVLLSNINFISRYVDVVPEPAWDLAEFATKPVTIIYPKAKNLAENLINSDKSIGIRITSEEFSQKLLDKYRKPIVSTSANISGKDAPRIFNEISEEIKSQVDYIVEYNQNNNVINKPSSIIKIDVDGQFTIIRE